MSNDPRNLKNPGSRGSIIYFLKRIIGNNRRNYPDIVIFCSRAPSTYQISTDAMIDYCLFFEWLCFEDSSYFLSETMKHTILEEDEIMNDSLIYDTINFLFRDSIFTIDMFSFDADENRIYFKNSKLPLEFSNIRNTLTNQGFFEINRSLPVAHFLVAEKHEKKVEIFAQQQKRTLSLESLLSMIEENSKNGELAEEFVLEYEKRRLPQSQSSSVRKISQFDVTAGYDIASFESGASTEFDRFIEVKSVSKDLSFYWSKNEYNVARLKNEQYYLYLVDISKAISDNYKPLIIKNPAQSVMDSDNWFVETDSFRIKYVDYNR